MFNIGESGGASLTDACNALGDRAFMLFTDGVHGHTNGCTYSASMSHVNEFTVVMQFPDEGLPPNAHLKMQYDGKNDDQKADFARENPTCRHRRRPTPTDFTGTINGGKFYADNKAYVSHVVGGAYFLVMKAVSFSEMLCIIACWSRHVGGPIQYGQNIGKFETGLVLDGDMELRRLFTKDAQKHDGLCVRMPKDQKGQWENAAADVELLAVGLFAPSMFYIVDGVDDDGNATYCANPDAAVLKTMCEGLMAGGAAPARRPAAKGKRPAVYSSDDDGVEVMSDNDDDDVVSSKKARGVHTRKARAAGAGGAGAGGARRAKQRKNDTAGYRFEPLRDFAIDATTFATIVPDDATRPELKRQLELWGQHDALNQEISAAVAAHQPTLKLDVLQKALAASPDPSAKLIGLGLSAVPAAFQASIAAKLSDFCGMVADGSQWTASMLTESGAGDEAVLRQQVAAIAKSKTVAAINRAGVDAQAKADHAAKIAALAKLKADFEAAQAAMKAEIDAAAARAAAAVVVVDTQMQDLPAAAAEQQPIAAAVAATRLFVEAGCVVKCPKCASGKFSVAVDSRVVAVNCVGGDDGDRQDDDDHAGCGAMFCPGCLEIMTADTVDAHKTCDRFCDASGLLSLDASVLPKDDDNFAQHVCIGGSSTDKAARITEMFVNGTNPAKHVDNVRLQALLSYI